MVSKRDIIQYINQAQGSFITTKELAMYFHVTQRTIQNYLKELREEFPNQIITRKGAFQCVSSLTLQETTTPMTFQERKSYILRNLLTKDQGLSFIELAQTLCISEITLQNEIKKIRRNLAPYELLLKTKQDTLFITGSIPQKKALMIDLIYGEAENSLVSLSTLNEIFPSYDAYTIRLILLDKLNEAQFFMDEYSLINLLLHIVIAMDQSRLLKTVAQEDVSQEYLALHHHFVHIIDEVCTALHDTYDVTFSSSNRYQFTLLLMTRAIRNKEIKELDTQKLPLQDDILDLVHHILSELYRIYDIDLNTNEFILAFSLHIKHMLIRLKEDVSIHNPLLYSIKATSPFIYDIAVYISNIIAKQQHVVVYDDEIAYIALHVGAKIEEINSTRDKLHATLVCPQYYSYDNQQFKRIESYFHDDVLFTCIVTNPASLHPASSDMILSTIPLNQDIPYVLISNFFTEADKEHIANRIKMIKRNRAKDKTMELLAHVIDSQLFTLHASFANKETALQTMGQKLIDKGYVGSEYIDKLFDREKISATNFDMIAIPHPIDYYARKTIIEVCILEEPILWGNTSVKIIFMFCINQHDFSLFSDVFSFLAGTCSIVENLQLLCQSHSYDEFMQHMIAFYD